MSPDMETNSLENENIHSFDLGIAEEKTYVASHSTVYQSCPATALKKMESRTKIEAAKCDVASIDI